MQLQTLESTEKYPQASHNTVTELFKYSLFVNKISNDRKSVYVYIKAKSSTKNRSVEISNFFPIERHQLQDNICEVIAQLAR